MKWKLLEPVKIGKKISKNRIAMAPMETRMSTIYGDITQNMLDYYSERAKGGAGMIIIENTFVDNKASRSSLSSSGLYSDHLIAGKNLLAEAIKQENAIAIIQLSHGGRQAREGATPFEAVAPSQVMCSITQRVPKVLSIEEIEDIENSFADAALRAKNAGFDGVEIHGAHGYLICSFLSPLTNLRKDEYGGNVENRARFPKNIIRKIREKVGEDFIVGYRISGSEFIPGGLEINDTAGFASDIQKDIDYIHVSAGIYESPSFSNIPSTYVPAGQLVPLACEIKKKVLVPVITVGAMNPRLAEQVLRDGKADLAAFGRALIADPQLPLKLAEDREEDIRPCIRGNEGCISRFYTGCEIRCEVNPACGREAGYSTKKTTAPKKILIAGGGVAGMEAARVAANMGHNVTLAEKDGRLGGHLIESTTQEFKSDEAGFLKWLVRQLEKSSTKILLNNAVTTDFVKKENPDVFIIATGSDYIQSDIKGAEKALLADVILKDTESAGKDVIIIGGGLVGSETALMLAINGHNVTIIEQLEMLAVKHEPGTREALINRLKQNKVKILTSHEVLEIKDGSVIVKDKAGNIAEISADTIVTATGLVSRDISELKNIIPKTYVIGDCVQARKIYQCMHEAWSVGDV